MFMCMPKPILNTKCLIRKDRKMLIRLWIIGCTPSGKYNKKVKL